VLGHDLALNEIDPATGKRLCAWISEQLDWLPSAPHGNYPQGWRDMLQPYRRKSRPPETTPGGRG
jgi:hypothetical protein